MKKLLLISIMFPLILNYNCKVLNLDSGFDIRGYWTYEIFELDGSCMTRGSWHLTGGKSSGDVCTIPPPGEPPNCYGTYKVFESKKVEISMFPARINYTIETREFRGDVVTENLIRGNFYYKESPNILYNWKATRW